MDFGKLVAISIGAIFINNFVVSRFLGLCPFMGVSKRTETALGMGWAVIFVMTMSSALCWFIWTFFLVPSESNLIYHLIKLFKPDVVPHQFDLTYLDTLFFILVIAVFVQFVEMVIRKSAPLLYESLGIYLPLITTNCCVLGVVKLNSTFYGYNFIESVVFGLSAGIGFTIALLIMSGLRERFDILDIPKPMRGLPIAFVTAALISIAFLGFSGLKF